MPVPTQSSCVPLPPGSYRLVSAERIAQALDRLADSINADTALVDPVVLCVMQGALVFAGQLIPRLQHRLEIDYIHVSRYHNTTQGRTLEWKAFPVTPLQGRSVLVLDDILDEGHTLGAIVDYCRQQQARNVRTAVLLHKRHSRGRQVRQADHVAMQVEDHYVFGFGMDYEGQYRQLNGIYALTDAAAGSDR